MPRGLRGLPGLRYIGTPRRLPRRLKSSRTLCHKLKRLLRARFARLQCETPVFRTKKVMRWFGLPKLAPYSPTLRGKRTEAGA